MTITAIKDVELGSHLHVSIINYVPHIVLYNESHKQLDAVLIGIYANTDRCIAWKENNDLGGLASYVKNGLGRWSKNPESYVMIPESKDYIYYKWIGADIRVKVIDCIISPNQVCAGCNLPAPHAKPNVSDIYVCKSCEFIGTL